MRSRSLGFTLVELVAVVVVLGVLAGIAIPRFVDLSEAAKQSNAKALAGQLGSASALNYSAFILAENYSNASLESAVPILNCSDAPAALEAGLPNGYGLRGSDGGSGDVNHLEYVECEVFDLASPEVSSTFVLHGVNPFGP